MYEHRQQYRVVGTARQLKSTLGVRGRRGSMAVVGGSRTLSIEVHAGSCAFNGALHIPVKYVTWHSNGDIGKV
jgi:hypothetical protein